MKKGVKTFLTNSGHEAAVVDRSRIEPMPSKFPRITVGLPVYNGQDYLKTAIESVLAQTYGDFILLISDNASTDDTEQICRSYVALDPRVRYIRHSVNHGLYWNFRAAFNAAQSEFFKWMAHDDICAPNLLEECIRLLDKYPEAVLVSPKNAVIVDDTIQHIPVDLRLDDARPNRRYAGALALKYYVPQLHGLFRAAALRQTPLLEDFMESDQTLIARVALMGRIVETEDYLFFHRLHASNASKHGRFYQDSSHTGSSQTNDTKLPHWKALLAYFRPTREVPLPLSERLLCWKHLLVWLFQDRNGLMLMGDIDQAVWHGAATARAHKLSRAFRGAVRYISPRAGGLA
jgi:glycosyltransferase involved in cell wall biosynthesis